MSCANLGVVGIGHCSFCHSTGLYDMGMRLRLVCLLHRTGPYRISEAGPVSHTSSFKTSLRAQHFWMRAIQVGILILFCVLSKHLLGPGLAET